MEGDVGLGGRWLEEEDNKKSLSWARSRLAEGQRLSSSPTTDKSLPRKIKLCHLWGERRLEEGEMTE